jgi:hypothetical protein
MQGLRCYSSSKATVAINAKVMINAIAIICIEIGAPAPLVGDFHLVIRSSFGLRPRAMLLFLLYDFSQSFYPIQSSGSLPHVGKFLLPS